MYHKFKQRYRFEIHKNTHSQPYEREKKWSHWKCGTTAVAVAVAVRVAHTKKDGRISTSRAYEKDIVTIIRGDTC